MLLASGVLWPPCSHRRAGRESQPQACRPAGETPGVGVSSTWADSRSPAGALKASPLWAAWWPCSGWDLGAQQGSNLWFSVGGLGGFWDSRGGEKGVRSCPSLCLSQQRASLHALVPEVGVLSRPGSGSEQWGREMTLPHGRSWMSRGQVSLPESHSHLDCAAQLLCGQGRVFNLSEPQSSCGLSNVNERVLLPGLRWGFRKRT